MTIRLEYLADCHDLCIAGKPYVAGHLDATICLSQVEAFIKDSEVAQEAIKVVGEHNVETALITMVSCFLSKHP